MRTAVLVFGHADVRLMLLPNGSDAVVYILPNGLATESLELATAVMLRILRARRG